MRSIYYRMWVDRMDGVYVIGSVLNMIEYKYYLILTDLNLMIELQEIYQRIPKITSAWTNHDIITWLSINQMTTCISTFKSNNINGQTFNQLTPIELYHQFNINSKFIIKRIMEWINTDRHQFDQYVQQSNTDHHITHNNSANKKDNPLKQLVNRQPQYIKFISSQYLQQSQYLLINYQTKTLRIYDNCKIGRANTNQIIINDDSVSRSHAQIIKNNQQYLLKDVGSKYGTYMQIITKSILHSGKIYLIGGTEIFIKSIKLYKLNNNAEVFDISITILETEQITNLTAKTSIHIGQKSKDILIKDQKIVNHHSKIFISEGKVYIEGVEGEVYEKLIKDSLVRIVDDKKYIFGLSNIRIKLERVQIDQSKKKEFN